MRIVAPVWAGARFLGGALERHVENRIGERRELVGERHHRQLAFEVGDGEPQHVALLEVAQVVEEALDIAGERRAFGAERGALGLPVGRGEARGGARELVEQDRMPREEPRRPHALRDEAGRPLEHQGILDEERVIGFTPVDRLHDREETIDGGRLAAGLARRGDDRGHELLEARADRRRERAAAASAGEFDEPPRGGVGVADAGFVQVLGEPRGIGRGLRVGEPRGDARRGRVRGLRFEERVERLLHGGAMRRERAIERVPVRKVHRLGDRRPMLGRARQGLRLLVVVVLQPMLEAAQERVRLREHFGTRRIDQPARGRGGEGGACRCRAQRRVAPAAHELEELHAELDLANAARADLDVVGLSAPARRLEDAPVQVAQRLEQPEIEIAAIDEGRHALLEARAGSRDDARLHPRIAFPCTRMGDEILLERRERRGERSRVAEGTKPHVDAERLAVRGRLRQQRDHLAPDARHAFAVASGVEEHEVDVGRDVELAAAELAQRGDDERVAFKAGVGIGHRGAHAFLGERGHRREDFVERGEAVQVAVGENHHHALAQAPEPCGERRIRRPAGERGAHLLARESAVGVLLEVGGKPRPRVEHACGVLREAKGAFERGAERLRCAASHGEALQ